MTPACARLDPFVDGELSAREADAFRAHLGGCPACAEGLADRAALRALSEELADEPPRSTRVTLPPRSRAPRRFLIPAALALAAGVSLFLGGRAFRSAPEDPSALALVESPTRSIEARVSYPPADRYRPYDVARGAVASGERVSLEALAALEKRKDFPALAAGMLLAGEPARARDYLEQAPSSAETEVDLAAVALARHDDEEALDRLDGVLAKTPNHPQALWNEALALEGMHLPLAAAEAWMKVAALGEPGWSDEAKRRGEALTATSADRATAWKRARAAFDAMGKGGELPPDEVIRAYPSYARLSLYDAARTTASRDRILSLVPLAVRLEGGDEGAPLVRYVKELAAGNLARRAQLVPAVAALDEHPLASDALAALVAKLGAAGEPDLALEAITLSFAWSRFPADVHRFTRGHDDPWLQILDARAAAYAAEARGDFAAAEAGLREGIRLSEAHRFDYLHAAIDLQLADMFLRTYRMQEASLAVADGLRASEVQAPGVWSALAGDAAELAEKRGAYPSMRARFRDVLLRSPPCRTRRRAHEALARERLLAMDLPGAGAELAADETCDEPMTLDRALISSILARTGDPAVDLGKLRAALAEARPTFTDGQRAFADVIEGQMLLRREPDTGRGLVERGMAAAKGDAGDGVAEGAIAWGRLVLALDAARRGDGAGALGLLSEANGRPTACALAVGVDYETAFAAATDAEGTVVSSFDEHVPAPFASLSPARLIPASLTQHLAGCPAVHVFAAPPVYGYASLLPPSIAWSFHLPRAPQPSAAKPEGTRLLVTDVTPPPTLDLPRLQPWSGPARDDAATAWLHGASATPRRVLEELATASEVEIHAHGLLDTGVSDAPLLALSADVDGRYALTAAAIEKAHLDRHPVVVVAACRAGRVAAYFHEPWSLPSAFLRAGARVVLASTAPVPDAEARPFFDAVLARIRDGSDPSVALRDERLSWLARGRAWVSSVLIFD
ncbi:MAG TPA: CHAT domain-containing protein [Polyangiaceae bacterium]|jgi:tetratricopeptide (TPR) repeat protein